MPKSTSTLPIEAAEFRRKIWDMRVSGLSTQQIADELSITPRAVQMALQKAVMLIDATKWLEQETELDLERLNRLLQAHWEAAIGRPPKTLDESDLGQPPSIDHSKFVLQVLERRAKLLGLDAPKRVDVRALVIDWAEKQGFDPDVVLSVVPSLLPEPKQTSWA